MERNLKQSSEAVLSLRDHVEGMYLVAKQAVKNVVNLIANTVEDRQDDSTVPNKQGAENHYNE